MGQRRRFTPEFKRHAVQLLNAGQRPAAEIARELGVPRNRLYKWQQEVTAHGGAFPGSGRQAHPAAWLVPNCAHRATTVSSWGLCEHRGLTRPLSHHLTLSPPPSHPAPPAAPPEFS